MTKPVQIGPLTKKALPPKMFTKLGPLTRAVSQMAIGDHRQIDAPDLRVAARVCLRAARRMGRQVTTRKMDNGTLGVWRIK